MQLRALLRAAVHGDVRIMLPLVVTLDEVRAARALLDEAARELERARRRRSARDVPLGVMIETPAAAVAARHVRATTSRSSASARTTSCSTRWPSIAATRTSRARFTPLHPAVLRLDPAHRAKSARRGRPRRRGVRRDGVAAAHGVRAPRARRAPAERRAALRAAREAHRAQRHRRRTRSSPRRRRSARSRRTTRARSSRVVSPT